MKKIILSLIVFVFFAGISFADETDEMIGQMILTGFHGNTTASKQYKTVIRQLEKGEIGGVILFKHNIKTKKDLAEILYGLNNVKAKFKPFIGIDQEGGVIQILDSENGFEEYLSAKDVAGKNTKDAYDMYFKLSKNLSELGFNTNFSPCVDVMLNEQSIINRKKRAYSNNPEIVTKYAKTVIDSHYENNIITSLKHFPGHGSPTGDTHLGLVDASSTWSENELIPYKELSASNNLQTVMVSHIFIKQLDEKFPSSLSEKIINGLLRQKIGYKGVIITDDLHMGAIRNNYDLEDIVLNFVNAKGDIMLFSNFNYPDMKTPEKVRKIIKNAIKEGKIDKKLIEESYKRITDLKQNLETAKN